MLGRITGNRAWFTWSIRINLGNPGGAETFPQRHEQLPTFPFRLEGAAPRKRRGRGGLRPRLPGAGGSGAAERGAGIVGERGRQFNQRKMEDYEKFCEKHLARLQGESLPKEISLPTQHKNISLIQFHGVPVLSPLLNLERRKEMQQEKQKALDLEIWKQNSKKRALLNRVQEILENVQVRKLSSVNDLDQWEAESIHPNLELKASAGFSTLPDISLPSSTADCHATKLEKPLESMPSDTNTLVPLSMIESVKSTEELVLPKQSASPHSNSMSTSASSSFSKVDIPVRAGTPPVLDSDSDEEFKHVTTFDHDSSIVRSLTGSYAKLPSPEPSMSPKMHRRRPRPLSMGHIVINNPVNAYELSPKNKGRATDLIIQDAADKANVSEPVPKFNADFAMLCSSKVHKTPLDTCDGLVFGKSNPVHQQSVNQLESKGVPVSATVEGQLALEGRGLYKVDGATCTTTPKLHEPYAASQSLVTQKLVSMNGLKPTNLLEKNKSTSPMELNKSYDVENPSPLLMQSQQKQQQMDTPSLSFGSEHFQENGIEKVKRRLDMDTDGSQKENNPYVSSVGTEEQESWWLQDQRCSLGSIYVNKNVSSDSTAKEEILKNKMLAFEEMRKRLEEQHAQQLSILIAEQEREQEKLQKEIEEQERRLKGKKIVTTETEIPKMNVSSGVGLEWRKISESGVLESFANTVTPNSFASTSDTPFYLWGPSSGGVSKISAARPISRAKSRWSQVFSPEVQMKFNKITALAKGFLTRRLMQTEKLKYLRQTVKDTMEFIKNFQSEAPLKRGTVSAQDASLHERVIAQLRAALYDIHDIFFIMEVSERMSILHHDREVRKEKMLRQMDKVKTSRERVTLSTATQKSLDRKKFMKAAEMGMPNKKVIVKQKTSEARVLQPNQGQNAPIHRLLCRQGTPKTSVKGVEQNRKKSSESRLPNKAISGVYAGRTQRRKPNVATI
ncbi:centriolar coiled-coil protein of isoform D [Alligator mississippiensis]|uniref:Centriolar coiled-coil protein of isoform D n=1 Tax=Alligator mississippiensis TaxID=8496 RepID=A0A151N1F8_ALLMI|nr:centriolar coiled-coil protein of isoform D [Alligator mississippiensis]